MSDAAAEALPRLPRALVTASMTKAFFPFMAVSSLRPVPQLPVSVRLAKKNSELDLLTLQKCIRLRRAIVQRDQDGNRRVQGPQNERGRLIAQRRD